VQGRLRNENITVNVETDCAHCSREMVLEIDSEMNFKAVAEECSPIIFIPDIDLLNLKEESIIDSF
jgi:hypothetical protein